MTDLKFESLTRIQSRNRTLEVKHVNSIWVLKFKGRMSLNGAELSLDLNFLVTWLIHVFVVKCKEDLTFLFR